MKRVAVMLGLFCLVGCSGWHEMPCKLHAPFVGGKCYSTPPAEHYRVQPKDTIAPPVLHQEKPDYPPVRERRLNNGGTVFA